MGQSNDNKYFLDSGEMHSWSEYNLEKLLRNIATHQKYVKNRTVK